MEPQVLQYVARTKPRVADFSQVRDWRVGATCCCVRLAAEERMRICHCLDNVMSQPALPLIRSSTSAQLYQHEHNIGEKVAERMGKEQLNPAFMLFGHHQDDALLPSKASREPKRAEAGVQAVE
mmetsp:Transcript_53142/g.142094  ORF Transcript_53142/g.142094 Transcript_53142/m.142094 type:complete len:124 (+) Transcript_53142:318-689(+)